MVFSILVLFVKGIRLRKSSMPVQVMRLLWPYVLMLPFSPTRTFWTKRVSSLKFSNKDEDENDDDSIVVDEILQEGETVEIESGAASQGYRELTLEELHKELDKAVANEDYEKAAKIRDEISKRK